MRFAVISYGTEGDTRPIVALCRGLAESGHEVTMLGEGSGAGLAAAQGVPFRALAGSIREALAQLLAAPGAERRTTKALASLAVGHTADWMRALVEEGRGSDAIVFSGLAAYVGLSVAEHHGVAGIGVGMQPIGPTGDFPSPFLPAWRLPRWANRASHKLVMAAIWREFRGSLNEARRTVTGQAERREMWRGYPILFGISPHLVPRPAEWPEELQITGDWPLPVDHWAPPDELQRFLDAGPAPAYVGFGSMVGFDRAWLLRLVVEALDGRRALLSGGWSGWAGLALPPNVLPVGPAPHDQLFRRVSMVVHHGGAGTSHTAVRAGAPSVVVPFAGDQFFWAERLRLAGVAPVALPHGKLLAGALRARMDEAASGAMRQRAAELSRAMAAERGVARAVDAIVRAARR